ncbi:Heat shock protein HslJ [Halopseudomonas litoralis]|uniref:Heat shock protein HslJ n=1 Tax=Halopseudomonas litoralis TaxID=797277 RepID=A0A1H1XNV9_9GAMM|nr:META domain-containing protein [Halopseudomonas litoralis]SDT10947.1 Heat shock protein HslJ [Halopseudomonas litoralis]
MHFNTFSPVLLAATLMALAGCSNRQVDAPAATSGANQPFTAALNCGRLPITATQQGDGLLLSAGDDQWVLRQAISASGARYVAEGEPETSLWFKGERAWLVLQGQEYPLCTPTGAIIEPYRASGNEPFWSVTLDGGLLRLKRLNEGELAAQPYVVDDAPGQVKTSGNPEISMQATDQLCRDSMSGMPYPQRVSVQVNGTTLSGCGGDPARLLQGGEWVVEDINGGGITDRSRVTLNFGRNGQVNGRASCNNFMGEYRLTGEGLSISDPATTRMACAPALMEQEQRVLRNLRNLQGFDFDDTGALLLRSADGSLKARLEH